MKTFLEWVGGEVFGWLSPSGKMYACGRFEHAETALKNPELKKHVGEETMGALADASEDEEKEDAEAEISLDMFRAGFLRVGSWGSNITFEGTSESIKNLYQKAKDIADERGGKAVFEPMRI